MATTTLRPAHAFTTPPGYPHPIQLASRASGFDTMAQLKAYFAQEGVVDIGSLDVDRQQTDRQWSVASVRKRLEKAPIGHRTESQKEAPSVAGKASGSSKRQLRKKRRAAEKLHKSLASREATIARLAILVTRGYMRSTVTAWREAVDREKFSLIEAARVAGRVTERGCQAGCGCSGSTKPRSRRSRRPRRPTAPSAPQPTQSDRALADANMAALIKEEEAIKTPKLTKKQKKELAAKKRVEEEAKQLQEKARVEAEQQEARRKMAEETENRRQADMRRWKLESARTVERRQEEQWQCVSTRTKPKKPVRDTIKRWRPCRSVELKRPCNRGAECRSAHSLEELTIEPCRYVDCGRIDCSRISIRPDGSFCNRDGFKPCGYIHKGESLDNYLRRMDMRCFLR